LSEHLMSFQAFCWYVDFDVENYIWSTAWWETHRITTAVCSSNILLMITCNHFFNFCKFHTPAVLLAHELPILLLLFYLKGLKVKSDNFHIKQKIIIYHYYSHTISFLSYNSKFNSCLQNYSMIKENLVQKVNTRI